MTRLFLILSLLAGALFLAPPANASTPCDLSPTIHVTGPPYSATVTVGTHRNMPLCQELDVTGIQWLLEKPGHQFPQHYGILSTHVFTTHGVFHFRLGSGPGHYALYGQFNGGVIFPNRLFSATDGDISGLSPLLSSLPGASGWRSDITYLR